MPRPSPHFLGPAADWSLGGGASIAACALAFAFRPKDAPMLLAVIGVLTWLLHWPHIAASFCRLFFWRAHAAAFPWAFWVAPGAVAFGTCAAFIGPAAFAPAWVRVALWWLSWHIAEQAAVLSEAYSRRAGRGPVERERALLRAACGALAVYHIVALECAPGPAHLFGVELPSARLPEGLSTLAALAAAAAFAGWLGAARQARAAGALPPIALLPPAALAVWFFAANQAAGVREALSLFHGAQYLLLCGACQLSEQARHGGAQDRLSELARWGAIVVAIGAGIGAALPAAASLCGADFAFAFGVIWASAQLYHFIADAVLWRWEDPAIAARIIAASAAPEAA